MASLTFTIKPDELLGLSALVELARAADGGDPDSGTGTGAVSEAQALMRRALADKLEQAGLPLYWPPPGAHGTLPIARGLHHTGLPAAASTARNRGMQPRSAIANPSPDSPRRVASPPRMIGDHGYAGQRARS